MMSENRARGLVLAIDDEPAVLAEVASVLGMAGYCCVTAANGADALALALKLRPDLIISDINLAGESGLDLCEQIQDQPALSEIPVVFLSGAQIPDVVRAAHAAGGTYYLRKPFDGGVLEEIVEKALWMPQLVRDRVQALAPKGRTLRNLASHS
ncbi:MAG: response regulator [Planctomycetaceae bacterium]|nr:response regulator [Planctomycetaceae bacterium]